MSKTMRRIRLFIGSVIALACIAPAHAGGAQAKAAQASAKAAPIHTSLAPPPAPPPAPSPQAELVRKYSPIKYCHGPSYPAVSWMQVKDFLDRHPQLLPNVSEKSTEVSMTAIPALEYPEVLRPAAMDGAVSVMVAVNKEGVAYDAMVVCSNHPEFSAAALVAVKAATFVAATRNGQPVESVATLPIDFHP